MTCITHPATGGPVVGDTSSLIARMLAANHLHLASANLRRADGDVAQLLTFPQHQAVAERILGMIGNCADAIAEARAGLRLEDELMGARDD